MKQLAAVCCLLSCVAFGQSRKEKEELILTSTHLRYSGHPDPSPADIDSVWTMVRNLHDQVKRVKGRPSLRNRRLLNIVELERLNMRLLATLRSMKDCQCSSLTAMSQANLGTVEPPKFEKTLEEPVMVNRIKNEIKDDNRLQKATLAQGRIMLQAHNVVIKNWLALGVFIDSAYSRSLNLQTRVADFQRQSGNKVLDQLCLLRLDILGQDRLAIVLEIESRVADLKVSYYKSYMKLLKEGKL